MNIKRHTLFLGSLRDDRKEIKNRFLDFLKEFRLKASIKKLLNIKGFSESFDHLKVFIEEWVENLCNPFLSFLRNITLEFPMKLN